MTDIRNGRCLPEDLWKMEDEEWKTHPENRGERRKTSERRKIVVTG